MAVIELPKQKVAPVRISPKRMIIYSMPKAGKTEMLSRLPSCLIVDADPDQGAGLYECQRIAVGSYQDVMDIVDSIEDEGMNRLNSGVPRGSVDLFPYRFIALDPIDQFEDFCWKSATEEYRSSVLNKNKKFEEKGYTSIRELPDGAGYPAFWNKMTDMCNNLSAVCSHLIITAHVREKYMGGEDEKKDTQAVVTELDITGKLGSILSASVDAIGYLYRSEAKDNVGQLMVSFQTNNKSVMGARQKYLAGQKMPFSWELVYPDTIKKTPEGGYELVEKKEVVA